MTSNSVPIPDKLNMTGNLATEWKRFCSQWKNYEVATDLATANKKKRAAILLACVGKEAFETFQTMEVADEADREDVDKVIAAFQNYCVGEVNVTYERYILNQRAQETGESFESFLSDLRKVVRTCEYGTIEDSIVKDRIVCGIRDDATRRKLL
jgi:hypothetical protein